MTFGSWVYYKETEIKVIRPITITPAKVLSSTATEIYATWSSATTYALAAKVVYNDKIYESLIDGNLNKQPNTNPTSWLDLGASNKTAMFDIQVNTQTTATTSFTVSFQPGSTFNAVSFLNLVGNTITVTVKDSPTGSVVYTETIQLDNGSSDVIDWYTYFFEDFDFRTEVVFQNIPPYANGVIEVTISAGIGALVAIGTCSVGTMIDLGDTQYGLNYGIRDYSIKETDEFGNTRFIQRAFSKRMSPTLMIENSRLNYVGKTLENLRATPTVYIAVDDPIYGGTIVFGFLKDWNIEINYPQHSMISMEVDGLI